MVEWKNNPLIVAVISGSAVLTTALFIVFTYVLPVYQKEDSNKISELQNSIDNKNELIKEITNKSNNDSEKKESDLRTLSDFKNKEINKLKIDLAKKDTELSDLKKIMNFQNLSLLYQKGSYLPIGYDAINIGDTRESIFKYYGTPRVIQNEKSSHISIKYGYGGIDDIVYYFRKKSGRLSTKDDVVSHIAVFKEIEITMDKEKEEFLKNLSLKDFLINNLGYTEPCNKDYYIWELSKNGTTVYYDDSERGYYMIFEKNHFPKSFDEECVLNKHYSDSF